MRETVSWNGKKWHRWPNSAHRTNREYYQKARPGGVDYLHRVVWQEAHGDIPDGYHIHHINGDCGDNRLENLECLSPSEHAKRHPLEGDRLERHLRHLDNIRPLASAWHRSEAAKEFHRRIAKKSWENFVPTDAKCDQCGKDYKVNARHENSKFCSNACKSASRRKSGVDDVAKQCPQCGVTFWANKYSKKRTCSRLCGSRGAAERKRKGL